MANDTYTFDTVDNSYFRGQDLGVTNSDGDTILFNLKENGMWSVNVKDDEIRANYPAEVKAALDALPDGITNGLYESAQSDFWNHTRWLAANNGFETTGSAGNSGGWMAVAGTEEWDPNEVMLNPKGEQVDQRERFLAVAFDAVAYIEVARESFFEEVRNAMQELQTELSEYADWIGAEVQTLDGGIFEASKLKVVNGLAAIYNPSGTGFAFGKEAKLVRKANGQVPARLTADPIMEQVFLIIEQRGELTKDEIDTFLDADEKHDPSALYVTEVARAVNDIERQIEAWNFKERGITHG